VRFEDEDCLDKPGRIATMSRERAGCTADHFAKDPSDAQNYDLVLNSSRFGVDECAELILAALERLQKGQPRQP
jgi:hypothetical protein